MSKASHDILEKWTWIQEFLNARTARSESMLLLYVRFKNLNVLSVIVLIR